MAILNCHLSLFQICQLVIDTIDSDQCHTIYFFCNIIIYQINNLINYRCCAVVMLYVILCVAIENSFLVNLFDKGKKKQFLITLPLSKYLIEKNRSSFQLLTINKNRCCPHRSDGFAGVSRICQGFGLAHCLIFADNF